MDHLPRPLVLKRCSLSLLVAVWSVCSADFITISLRFLGPPVHFHRQGFDHHHAAFERQSHVMVRTVVRSTQQPPGYWVWLWSKPRGTVLHRLWRMLQWQVMCDSVDSVHVDFRFASQRKRVQQKTGRKKNRAQRALGFFSVSAPELDSWFLIYNVWAVFRLVDFTISEGLV